MQRHTDTTKRGLRARKPPDGTVNSTLFPPDSTDEQQSESLPQTPVSSPDEQSRSLAVSQIQPEPSRHQRTLVSAGDRRHLRKPSGSGVSMELTVLYTPMSGADTRLAFCAPVQRLDAK